MVINVNKFRKLQAKEKAQQKHHTILLVDDETSNLKSLSMVLDNKYHLLTAQNGRAALQLIESYQQPIHCIISDQRMPEMTGAEFLHNTIPISPKSIRILLTAYTDIDVIIHSINEGRIYKFLAKPIEPEFLRITVKRALEAFDLEQQNTQLLDQLTTLNASLEEKVTERTQALQTALEKLNQSLASLEELSLTDELTRLCNRRAFNQIADQRLDECRKTGKKMAFCLLDVDFFKAYNDTYGHQTGDEALAAVGAVLTAATQGEGDYAFRTGGEEFVILTNLQERPEIYRFIDHIRQAIEQKKIPHSASQVSDYITASFGVVLMQPKTSIEDLNHLYKLADRALYQAKNHGRNCIKWA